MKANLKRGFTLIELMVILGIIGILAVMSIPNFIYYRDTGAIEGEKIALLDIRLNAEKYIALYNEVPTMNDLLREFYGGGELFPYNNFTYVKIVEDGVSIVEDIDLLYKKTLAYQIQGTNNLHIANFVTYPLESLDYLFLQTLISTKKTSPKKTVPVDQCTWDYNHGHGNDPNDCDCDNPALIKQCTQGKNVGKAKVCCNYCCVQYEACNFPYCQSITTDNQAEPVIEEPIVNPNSYYALKCNHNHISLQGDPLVLLRGTEPMAWRELRETISSKEKELVSKALNLPPQ